MEFKLIDSLRGASDQDLLGELRRSAHSIHRETITMAEYEQIGRTHPSTIQRRFGSWSKALQLAGLTPSRSKFGITDEELYRNLKSVWTLLGRQPSYGDMRTPTSSFSVGTYENRFGSWSKALSAFVVWVNVEPEVQAQNLPPHNPASVNTYKGSRRTRREISERQRFRILMRDGFDCKTCGASPLAQQGNVELHVDHVLPWSKGGETVDQNLETKCVRCNLGKGNAFSV